MQELGQKTDTILRIWDESYNLVGEIPKESKGETDGCIELPIDHPVAQWILERPCLTNANLTIDSPNGRWSGCLDRYKVIKPQGWFNTKIFEGRFISHADRFDDIAKMHRDWTKWDL